MFLSEYHQFSDRSDILVLCVFNLGELVIYMSQLDYILKATNKMFISSFFFFLKSCFSNNLLSL